MRWFSSVRGRCWCAIVIASLLSCGSRPERYSNPAPAGKVWVVTVDDSGQIARPDSGLRELDASVDSGVLHRVDASTTTPYVRIRTPMHRAELRRDQVSRHEWIARAEVQVEGRNVARVELAVDGAVQSVMEGSNARFTLELFRDGEHRVAIRGLDAANLELARDEITLIVRGPRDDSCHAMLNALGLDWETAGPNRGIEDPVWIQPYFDGVSYRFVSRDAPTRLLVDCELGPTFDGAGPIGSRLWNRRDHSYWRLQLSLHRWR